MSNIVRTWEDEALPAGEIELTDAQLAAVYGACGDGCRSDWDGKEFHKKVEKKIKIYFEFDFEEEIKKEWKKDWD